MPKSLSSNLTVGAVVANAARGAPNETAAVIADTEYSFALLDQAGTSVAQQLTREGSGRGDVALVLASTSFDLLAHYVGCARTGIVFAPLNPGLDTGTISAIAEQIQPAVVLADDDHAAVAATIAAPRRWFGTHTVSGPVQLPEVTSTDPHIAFFTSGTTGAPKAAVVSHGASVLRSHPGSQLEPRGPALCPYPLFHMAGWTIGLQQWHARAAVVFVDASEAEPLVTALRHHHIERFNAIPAVWARLADHLREQPEGPTTLPSLRFADTGTSPTSPELLETIVGLAPNAHVRVFYGSSEAGNVASLHHDDLLTRPGRCGRPSLLTEVSQADDGELLVRGPLMFDGYLADPEATEAAFDGTWYRTGDRAEIDNDGYLSIVGRTGTVIRSGGESISPESVESALRTHSAVADAAVFGMPDERWGELVCAAVVARRPVVLDDLRRHLGPNGEHPLPSHQHPRRLLVLDEIPRTAATGQADRSRLRALAAEATP